MGLARLLDAVNDPELAWFWPLVVITFTNIFVDLIWPPRKDDTP